MIFNKVCISCNLEKSLECFHKKTGSRDGYRSICKDCRKTEHVQRYLENKEQWNARAVAWQKANKEATKEHQQKYRLKNKDKRNDYKKEWIDKNRGKVNAYNSYKHSLKKQRTPAWLTAEEKERIVCLYQVAAMYSRESGYKWHVDHIVPLQGESVSGLHVPWNLRVIPATDNLRKYNKHG